VVKEKIGITERGRGGFVTRIEVEQKRMHLGRTGLDKRGKKEGKEEVNSQKGKTKFREMTCCRKAISVGGQR